jgi:hypothetical protein
MQGLTASSGRHSPLAAAPPQTLSARKYRNCALVHTGARRDPLHRDTCRNRSA